VSGERRSRGRRGTVGHMSAKPLLVEPVAQQNEEDDPVAAAFDNAPFMEATPAMIQAVAEMTDADRAGPFVPHDEVMRRLREHHGRK